MNESEQIKMAVDLLQKLGGSFAVYWNILIAGSSAAIGFAFKGKGIFETKTARFALMAANVVFAMSNLVAIRSLVEKNKKILSYLSELKAPEQLNSIFVMGISKIETTVFHLIMQIMVLFLVWVTTRNANSLNKPEVATP